MKRLKSGVFGLLLISVITASAQTKGTITGRVVAEDGSGAAGSLSTVCLTANMI